MHTLVLWLGLLVFTGPALAQTSSTNCEGQFYGFNLPEKVTFPSPYREEIESLLSELKWDGFSGRCPYSWQARSLILGKQFQHNEDHAVGLWEVGCQLAPTSTGIELLPPKSLELVFERAYAIHSDHIRRGLIQPSELILPALIFRKKGLIRNGPRTVLVRPSIDEWPDPKLYRIDLVSREVPYRLWNKSMAEGKSPFSIKDILLHELGHLTERVRHPRLMAAQKRYYKERSEEASESLPEKWLRSFGLLDDPEEDPNDPITARNIFVGEVLSLPDLSKREAIERLVQPFLPNEAEHVDLNTIKEQLTSMTFEQRKTLIGLLVRNYEALLLKHGGILRDPYNVQKYFGLDAVVSRVSYAVEHGPEVSYSYSTDYSRYLADVPHGIGLELELLYLLAFHWEGKVWTEGPSFVRSEWGSPYHLRPYHRFLVDELEPLSSEKRERQLQKAVVYRAAQLITAFYVALKLNLSPEEFVQDATPLCMDSSSKAYQLIASFAQPKSFLQKAFLERCQNSSYR